MRRRTVYRFTDYISKQIYDNLNYHRDVLDIIYGITNSEGYNLTNKVLWETFVNMTFGDIIRLKLSKFHLNLEISCFDETN